MFKLSKLFKAPDAHTMAFRDLEEAKRRLLQTQAIAEHETKMVEYYQGVISRLTKYVHGEAQPPQKEAV